MKAIILVVLVAALISPAAAHGSLADVLQADSQPHIRGDLPEAAVQSIIESVGLGWETGWPDAPSLGGVDVRAYVATNRRYCLLTKARWSEWGQFGPAQYACIAAETGLLWLRNGSIVATPTISAKGVAALFSDCDTTSQEPLHPVRLLMVDTDGDALITRSWPDHLRRPLQRRVVEELYAFSPDGDFFMLTMNCARQDSDRTDAYTNTILYCIDPRTAVEQVEPLGPFWPRSLEVSPAGAVLKGEWRQGTVLFESFEEGLYRIIWSPWQFERAVTRVVEP